MKNIKNKIINILNKKINNTYLILFSIFILALVLRVWNLTILDPYTDEYAHLSAVKDLINESNTSYKRSYLLTLLVKFFTNFSDYSNFYDFLFWARIPGVIIGSLTIFPIYFLGKKINKNIGLLSSFLWAVSPWAIGVSKTIREYTLNNFIILIIILLLINSLQLIINKRNNTFKNFLNLFLIVIFLFYSYKIETTSTIKIGIAMLFVTTIYFLFINFKKIKKIFLNTEFKKYYNYLPLAILIIILTIITKKIVEKNPFVSITEINNNYNFIKIFFSKKTPVASWWIKDLNLLFPLLLISSGLVYSYNKKKKFYFLYSFIFIVLFVFYVFFFNREFRARYIFYLLPFFTILIAGGIYALIKIKSLLKDKFINNLYYFIIIALITTTINPINIIKSISSSKGSPSITTNEWHENMKGLSDYLDKNYKNKYYFISSLDYYLWMIKSRYNLDNKNYQIIKKGQEANFENITDTIKNKNEGFIILDYENNYNIISILDSKNFIENKKIEKIMTLTKNVHIYKWSSI